MPLYGREAEPPRSESSAVSQGLDQCTPRRCRGLEVHEMARTSKEAIRIFSSESEGLSAELCVDRLEGLFQKRQRI